MSGGMIMRLAGRWHPVDLLIVAVLAAATETLAWTGGVVGVHIGGPRPITAALPLLLAVPLLWRRTQPLLAWTLVAAGIVMQALVSENSAEGLEIIAAFVIGSYSVAAYDTRRRSFIGLGVLAVAYGVFAFEDRNFRTWRASEVWATTFFALVALAAWLAGAGARSRRESRIVAARAAVLEDEAELAIADERARVARELHDIVSHNLSVVVLQAAGARARAEHAPGDINGTLEKIESSGREALVEMRRMLGLLRASDQEAALAPQPGLAQLPDLVESVRGAGVPAELVYDGDCDDVPPVVALSTYRIVQEALTNTLKHAGATRTTVEIRRDADAVLIDVTDDGCGPHDDEPEGAAPPGHGLTGMRERATLLGGELQTSRGANGGFVVRARLPLTGSAS